MTFEEYQAFVAQGFTRIPVAKTVLADFDTPLSSTSSWPTRPIVIFWNLSMVAKNGVVTALSAYPADAYSKSWVTTSSSLLLTHRA